MPSSNGFGLRGAARHDDYRLRGDPPEVTTLCRRSVNLTLPCSEFTTIVIQSYSRRTSDCRVSHQETVSSPQHLFCSSAGTTFLIRTHSSPSAKFLSTGAEYIHKHSIFKPGAEPQSANALRPFSKSSRSRSGVPAD